MYCCSVPCLVKSIFWSHVLIPITDDALCCNPYILNVVGPHQVERDGSRRQMNPGKHVLLPLDEHRTRQLYLHHYAIKGWLRLLFALASKGCKLKPSPKNSYSRSWRLSGPSIQLLLLAHVARTSRLGPKTRGPTSTSAIMYIQSPRSSLNPRTSSS